MKKQTVYIPCTMSESDVIANHSQGALPLKEVKEVYVMDREQFKKAIGEAFKAGGRDEWQRANLINPKHPNLEQYIESLTIHTLNQ
jgi:hypothetical protein